MKLLFLYRYGILGGVTTQLVNRFAYLQQYAEVHVGFLQEHGGSVAFGPEARIVILATPGARKSYVREHRFDAITVIDTPEVYPDLRAAKFGGTIVHETHTTTRNLAEIVELRASPPMDVIFTPSVYLQRRLLTEFGFEGVRPVHVVPNCLDTRLFTPSEVEVRLERRIVLWVGKLDDHKNWRGFLMVCEELSRRREDWEFWMVGGETANQYVASALFATVDELGLTGRLRWIPRVEYSAMPRLYCVVVASGGALLSTSIDESFGMTVCEALACGCPVVAARVGALTELLDDELSAGLYPLGDIDAAARAVEMVAEDETIRRSFSTLAPKRVAERYSIEVVGSRYLRLLREATAG